MNRRLFKLWVILAVWLAAASGVWAGESLTVTVTQNADTVRRYDIYELTLENAAHYDNPWEDPSITVVFTAPSGSKYTVGGFLYDLRNQTNTWKVRFAPREEGAWTWSLSFVNTTATKAPVLANGKFTCTKSARLGFLRIHPCNNYRFMTEGEGRAFYPIGGYYWCPSVKKASYKDTNSVPKMSQVSWCTDNYTQPATIDDYMQTSGRAGQNTARWMTGQDDCSLALSAKDGFNVKGTGKNKYLLDAGIFTDDFMAAIHRVDWKCLMTMLAIPPELIGNFNNVPQDPAITRALLNYHQYVINRYGAYVDIWELANEQKDVPSAYIDTVIAYVRAHDPYHHLITTSYTPYDYADLDVVSRHGYSSVTDLGWIFAPARQALQGMGHINDATGYLEPMLLGEWGEEEYLGTCSPIRYRLSLWISFLNRGAFIYTVMGPAMLGSQERAVSKIFSDYIADFDPAAKPDTSVALTPAEQLTCYALSSPVDLGLDILHTTTQNSVLKGATVKVTVPADNMRGQWMDPATGLFLGQPLTLQAGRKIIPIPDFKNDIVLRLHAGGPAETVQFNSSSYRVNADQSSVKLTINRCGNCSSAATVNYATEDGLAKAGTHYKATTGIVRWEAGEVGPKTITVPLINTGVLQADCDFMVSLSEPNGGAALGTAHSALVTLVNVVTNTAVLEPTYVVANGAGKIVFTAKRLGPGSGPLTMYYSTRHGTALNGVDYSGISLSKQNTLVWKDGDLSPKTFSVTILSNSGSTKDKTFEVVLDDFPMQGVLPPIYPGVPCIAGSSPAGCNRSTVIIQANPASSPGVLQFSGYSDCTPAYNYCYGAAYTVSGTEAAALISISRIGGKHGPVTVEYATSKPFLASVGSAAANVNYLPVAGTLSWADGETADKIIKVPLIKNPSETGALTVWFELSKPTGGAILGGAASVRLTIVYPSAAP